jgi:glyoxylase-like metal-dependent hydrolase (beta-lactamase superfamily II)
MTTVTVGNVQVTPVIDTPVLMNPQYFMPNHAEQMYAEYEHLLDERRLMRMSITCYLVRSDGRTLLVDTGLGNRRRPNFPRGHLDDSLEELGVDPGEIDIVLNTHLHIDHTGWNTVDDEQGNSRIFFPNAEFWVQQPEWDYWVQPEHLDNPEFPHLRETVLPLKDSGRLHFVKPDDAITADLTYVATPGHTPGHVAIGIHSAGERAIIIGDASHHPIQLDHPDWSPSADVDPVQSYRTRERLFEEAVADGRTWIAGHWMFPGVGRIVRLDGKRVFRAL